MKAKKILFYSLLPLFFILAMVGVPPPSLFVERKKNPNEQSQSVEENEENEK
ncbi:hypothetical protein [Bdellovibrio sp. HCB2-146]|uniref:hypothetical protein n=1 Tax=Bdellovibrio sp. HCB2-146 TaxID=3394362 RepID=UPI0039BCEE7A